MMILTWYVQKEFADYRAGKPSFQISSTGAARLVTKGIRSRGYSIGNKIMRRKYDIQWEHDHVQHGIPSFEKQHEYILQHHAM